MNISETGIKLIKNHEGCRLEAYRCPAGVLTIGYGHTGIDVKPGIKITQEKAGSLLKNDLIIHCNNVSKLVKVSLKQNQFDALVSLEFNIGYGNFKSSSILRLLNTGKYKEAGERFLGINPAGKTLKEKYTGYWVFDSNKNVLPGLIKRRQAEKELFLK